jgi:hypothetical protein
MKRKKEIETGVLRKAYGARWWTALAEQSN